MIIRARFRIALAAFSLSLAATSSGWAADPMELLKDFVHYCMVAKPDLAAANAQALIDSGITNAELAELLDKGADMDQKRFDAAVDRAQRVPELETTVSELAHRIQLGQLDLARDPKRIDEAVNMLTGTLRQKGIAEQRLVAAGEFAVPSLLRQITEGTNESLKTQCQDMIRRIGLQAVTPLCEALPRLTAVPQRIACDLLGEIGYSHAAPYLKELAANEGAPAPVREAASRAFKKVGGVDLSVSELYGHLGRQYFDSNTSLIAHPAEDVNNIWSYDDFVGLVATPVSTSIYNEVMAMRMASKAVKLDAKNTQAVSLYVAANLKRENDLPDGATDPVFGESKYTPDFYATVFGTQICLDVLALAIDSLDTHLVRDAITALSKTTGGSNLFAKGTGRQPLLEALQYPDRRVQYEASLTLGRALPQVQFAGDNSVVPLLASAVRLGNKSFAIVLADDPEDRRVLANSLGSLGFEVVGTGANTAEIGPDINHAVGVDLAIVRTRSAEAAKETLHSLRAIPKIAAAPVYIIAPSTDMTMLKRELPADSRLAIARMPADDAAFGASIDKLMQAGSGGRMTEAEAEVYAIEALSTLRDIAISNNRAYQISDAEAALVDALQTRAGGTRLLVADILALIDSDRAQRSLFDAAFAAAAEEQLELLRRTADSVKRFGDKAEERHLSALVDLVANSTGDTAEAAATLHGALNLPSTDALKLIP